MDARSIPVMVSRVFGYLQERQQLVLTKRSFADKPLTLEVIGSMLGVTRERARQVEKASLITLTASLEGAAGEEITELLDLLRPDPGHVRYLPHLLRVRPELGEVIEQLGVPLWRVLGKLYDGFEIRDNWVAEGTMSKALANCKRATEQLAGESYAVELGDLHQVEDTGPEMVEVRTNWAKYCGFVIYKGHALTGTRRINGYVAGILTVAGTPMTTEELVDKFEVKRSLQGVSNALSSDDRFMRVGRDTWGLTSWGLEPYRGIRGEIRVMLEAAGGQIELRKVVNEITSRYSVSENSVMGYASGLPFVCREGMISMATEEQRQGKAPRRTARLYRHEKHWAYRVTLTPDHFRGSGSPGPMGLAGALGLEFGDTRKYSHELGAQSVAWKSLQPQFGTVRRFLMDTEIAVGDDVFYEFYDDGSFGFWALPPLGDDPVKNAFFLVGGREYAGEAQAWDTLARAVQAPDSAGRGDVVEAYRERHDDDVVAALRDALI